MNDNELSDLCKEVYRRTEWETKARYYMTINGKSSIWHWQDAQEFEKSERVPIYTSDYLLEKLPKHVGDSRLTLTTFGDHWEAAYEVNSTMLWNQDFKSHAADTPLKALLKLVIALHEAGDVL